MKGTIVALLLAIMLMGCSSGNGSEASYADNMQKGKDAYIKDDFKTAIAYFGEAKKINPTSEANDYLNKSIAKEKEATSKASAAPEAPSPSKETASSPEDKWKALAGNTYVSVDIDNEPFCNDNGCTTGYGRLKISKVENGIVTFDLDSVSDSQRVASAENVEGKIREDGSLHFQYTDSWYNGGEGTVVLEEDKLVVKAEVTKPDESAMWSLGFDSLALYLENSPIAIEAGAQQEAINAAKYAEYLADNAQAYAEPVLTVDGIAYGDFDIMGPSDYFGWIRIHFSVENTTDEIQRLYAGDYVILREGAQSLKQTKFSSGFKNGDWAYELSRVELMPGDRALCSLDFSGEVGESTEGYIFSYKKGNEVLKIGTLPEARTWVDGG